jgi:hypothetical protein
MGSLNVQPFSEIIFPADSQLKHIDGFQKGNSFSRFETPASVRLVTLTARMDCQVLSEIIFRADSQLG